MNNLELLDAVRKMRDTGELSGIIAGLVDGVPPTTQEITLARFVLAVLSEGPVACPEIAANVLDGWALVPIEPTPEMIAAAMDSEDVTFDREDETVFYVHHDAIYAAMLSAAPQITDR